MIDVTAAIKSAEELDKAVGIIAKLVGKLKAKPDLAAQKLGEALGHVAKTLYVVDNAATEFLSLGLDEGALEKHSKLLLEIETGSLRTEVERGRGHCEAIERIYKKYLHKWFESVFNPDEYRAVEKVFQDLAGADGVLFHRLQEVAVILQQEASEVLNLVVNGEEENARKRVLSALPALRPLRKTIAKTMQTIYSMQGEFVDITGAV